MIRKRKVKPVGARRRKRRWDNRGRRPAADEIASKRKAGYARLVTLAAELEMPYITLHSWVRKDAIKAIDERPPVLRTMSTIWVLVDAVKALRTAQPSGGAS